MSLGADPRKLDYFRELPQLEAKNTVFVNEKRDLFCTHSTVRTFFWPSPKPPKWWTKAGPKNTQRDVKSHVLSALPVKKSFEHRKSRRYGEMGAALEDGARASKIGFLDSTVEIFSSSPSCLRSGHRRKIIHCSLNFGSVPATDKKRLLLKGFCLEN